MKISLEREESAEAFPRICKKTDIIYICFVLTLVLVRTRCFVDGRPYRNLKHLFSLQIVKYWMVGSNIFTMHLKKECYCNERMNNVGTNYTVKINYQFRQMSKSLIRLSLGLTVVLAVLHVVIYLEITATLLFL